MTVGDKLLRGMGLVVAIGLTQVPTAGFGQEKANPQAGPPPFVQLPSAASGALGGGNVAQVLVFTKQGKLDSFYGRSVNSVEQVAAPPGLSITVENVDDPAKDIVVTATIPRSSLQAPGQPIDPIEVIPAILVKTGPSSCGWAYYGSGGGAVCQRVCY